MFLGLIIWLLHSLELRHFNLTLGSKEYSKQVPFRCADASHHSVKEMFSDFIVHREAHQFRSCIITFVGVCCCTVTKGELDDIRNLLNSYPHCYRFNWCCHRSARIFARYGNKRYEYSPAPAETKEDAPACRHSKVCESRHWSSDIDIEWAINDLVNLYVMSIIIRLNLIANVQKSVICDFPILWSKKAGFVVHFIL